MSWMFRWLSAILSHLPFRGDDEAGWVEPSNAVTRAVLGGVPLALPIAEASPIHQPAPVVELPQRSQPATRTAQRTRRRRAGRAA
ncbi:MAG: hypothetical protein C3F10_11510 [Dehalococcoidia bacterium]|nr:MAG: hypothetical protein C3F10_11510 [Dehalococcoidia bacterium]